MQRECNAVRCVEENPSHVDACFVLEVKTLKKCSAPRDVNRNSIPC